MELEPATKRLCLPPPPYRPRWEILRLFTDVGLHFKEPVIRDGSSSPKAWPVKGANVHEGYRAHPLPGQSWVIGVAPRALCSLCSPHPRSRGMNK